MTTDIQTALANEARRQILKTKEANLKGAVEVSEKIYTNAYSLSSAANSQLLIVKQELLNLESGNGPGITASFGDKSAVTQFLEIEREAAKSASIDYIKANPECTEVEAAAAWNAAAISSHPDLPLVVQDGLAMGKLYQANLHNRLLTPNASWEDQRSWIIATPKEVIMAA